MKRRRRTSATPRCVLDSGALSVLAAGSARARAWLRWVIEHDGVIQVPTPVLVEATSGDAARDAGVNRVLNLLERAAPVLAAPDERTARCAGALRHRVRSDDGIDALVAAAAVGDGSPCALLTTDPADLSRLLAREPQVAVLAV